jgi:hypothetical protein
MSYQWCVRSHPASKQVEYLAFPRGQIIRTAGTDDRTGVLASSRLATPAPNTAPPAATVRRAAVISAAEAPLRTYPRAPAAMAANTLSSSSTIEIARSVVGDGDGQRGVTVVDGYLAVPRAGVPDGVVTA